MRGSRIPKIPGENPEIPTGGGPKFLGRSRNSHGQDPSRGLGAPKFHQTLGVAPKFPWEESQGSSGGFPKSLGGSQIPWAGLDQRSNPPRGGFGEGGTPQNSQGTTGTQSWLSGEGELGGNGEKLEKKWGENEEKQREIGKKWRETGKKGGNERNGGEKCEEMGKTRREWVRKRVGRGKWEK